MIPVTFCYDPNPPKKEEGERVFWFGLARIFFMLGLMFLWFEVVDEAESQPIITWDFIDNMPTSTCATGCNWQDVVWSSNDTQYVAVGMVGGIGAIMTSQNGWSWSEANSIGGTGILHSIAWSPTHQIYVVVGENGHIQSSTNGIDWTMRTSPIPTFDYFAVEWSEQLDLFLAVGSQSIPLETGIEFFVTSFDGENWTATPIITPDSDEGEWRDIASNTEAPNFTIVSQTSSPSENIGFTNNAITWNFTFNGNLRFQDITLNSNQSIYLASRFETINNCIRISLNGVIWNQVVCTQSSHTTDVKYIEEIGLYLYVRAIAGDNNIRISSDATTWTTALVEYPTSVLNTQPSEIQYSDTLNQVIIIGIHPNGALIVVGNVSTTVEPIDLDIPPLGQGNDVIEWRQLIYSNHTTGDTTSWDGQTFTSFILPPHNLPIVDSTRYVQLDIELLTDSALGGMDIGTFQLQLDGNNLRSCAAHEMEATNSRLHSFHIDCPLQLTDGSFIEVVGFIRNWTFSRSFTGSIDQEHLTFSVYFISYDYVTRTILDGEDLAININATLTDTPSEFPIEDFWIPLLLYLGVMAYAFSLHHWGWSRFLLAMSALIGVASIFIPLPIDTPGIMFLIAISVILHGFLHANKGNVEERAKNA